jgi:predicted SAM-dependent methyltransferase
VSFIESSWVPIRRFLWHCRHGWRLRGQKRALKAFSNATQRKIIIGSSGTRFDGWVSTDRQVLDLLCEGTWERYFSPGSLDAILAEHVWEHLSADAALKSAATCYRFLKPGGYLRIAVPDGFHPDSSYIEEVRPGGVGPGADDHKVLYNYSSLIDLFARVGFKVRLYEYFDEEGKFHYLDWDSADGMVQRSKRFDSRNSTGNLAYTSIVLDAIKPGNKSR